MKKNISILLTIILLLVIASTGAFAAELNSASVKGTSAGIESVCGGDHVNINAQIKDSEEEPVINDFFIGYESRDFLFSEICTSGFSCSAVVDTPDITGGYDCVCQTQWCPDTEVNFQVKYKGSGSMSVKHLSLSPDVLPPKINSIQVSQVATNKIEVKYDVEDEGCVDCDSCSGLKSIDIIDETVLGTIDLDGDSCEATGSEVFDMLSDGNKDITFKVKDNLWLSLDDDDTHSTQEVQSIEFDFSSPVIHTQWELLVNGADQDYIGRLGFSGATVKVQVREENLKSIEADLSMLGRNQDITVNSDNYDEYCILEGNDNKCTFTNVRINPANEIRFRVKAIDLMGNEKEAFLPKNLLPDYDSPLFVTLEKDVSEDGISYISKKNNNFIARFTEDGSGFDNKNVYLVLTQFNSGLKKADKCEQSSGYWNCYFDNVTLETLSGENVNIRLDPMSSDDAGNQVVGDNVGEFFVDTKDPEILSFDAYGVGRNGEVPYFTSGDAIKLEFVVNTTGSPVKEFKVDISNLNTDAGNVTKDCTGDEFIYKCSWSLTEKVKGGDSNSKITLYVEDMAGNIISEEKSTVVYGDRSGTPDNYGVTILEKQMVPKKINRLIATTVPNPPGYKILVPFKLTGGSSGVSVISYALDDCKIKDPEGLLSKPNYDKFFKETLNPTKSPVRTTKSVTQANDINNFEFIFSSTAPDIDYVDELEMNCTFKIYQAFGNNAYINPEIENITIKMKLVGSAFEDEPSRATEKKINEEIERLKKYDFIDTAAKVTRTLESVCGIFDSIAAIWSSFSVIEGIGAGLAESKVTGVSQAGEGIYKVGCVAYESIGWVMQKVYYGKDVFTGEFNPKSCQQLIDADEIASGVGKKVIDESTGKIKQEMSKEGMVDVLRKNVETSDLSSIKFFKGTTIRNWCRFLTCQHTTEYGDAIIRATGGNMFDGMIQGNDDNTVFKDGYLNFGSFGQINYEAKSVSATSEGFLMSAATVCIPGIVYNVEKYRIINCEYVKCMKDIASKGGDISICSAKKAESTCVAVMGELTAPIGAFRILQSVSQGFATMLQDLAPNALKLVFDSAICNNPKAPKLLNTFACDIPSTIYTIVDKVNNAKSMTNAYDTSAFSVSGGRTVCDDVLADDFMMTEEERDLEE